MTEAVVVAVVGLLLAGLLVAWVLAALRGDGHVPSLEDGGLLALLTERQALLDGLRDLDADLATGRISAEGHAALREEAMRSGSRLLAAIDDGLGRQLGRRSGALAALEDAVLRQRQPGGPMGEPRAASDLAKAGATLPSATLSSATHTGEVVAPSGLGKSDDSRSPRESRAPSSTTPRPCPACGRNTAGEDRFCRHCGHDLSTARLA